MTTPNHLNIISPFIQDLDENIVKNVSVDTEEHTTTTIDFINPVTSSIDRVIFEGTDPNVVESIYYVIGYSEDKVNEELIMEDLNDLYDFILIDEEN